MSLTLATIPREYSITNSNTNARTQVPETNVFYRIGVVYDGQNRLITLFVNNVETETKSFPHQGDGSPVSIDVGSSATIGGKKSGDSFGEHGRMVLGAFAITNGAYVVVTIDLWRSLTSV